MTMRHHDESDSTIAYVLEHVRLFGVAAHVSDVPALAEAVTKVALAFEGLDQAFATQRAPTFPYIDGR